MEGGRSHYDVEHDSALACMNYSCPGDDEGFEVEFTDGVDEHALRTPLEVPSRSGLFAAFQRSLSDAQQAMLARWDAGDYRADDELLTAPERAVEPAEDQQALSRVRHRSCLRPPLCRVRYQYRREQQESAAHVSTAEMHGESVDDEKQ